MYVHCGEETNISDQMSQQTNWELVITLDLLYSFLYFSAHT